MAGSADGIIVEVEGAADAGAYLDGVSRRLLDLTPANRIIGLEIESRVNRCFTESHDARGNAFDPLAPATIADRLRGRADTNKRTKSGALTKGAVRRRDQLSAPGGLRPLVRSGRAMNSQHWVAGPQSFSWSAVWYLFFHMVGGKHLPQRNPTPFERVADGWALEPSMDQFCRVTITTYVLSKAS